MLWVNLNNTIETVLNMSNELLSKHGIDKVLSFEELRRMLHGFGKADICRFLTSDLPISGSWLGVALYRSTK